MRKNWLLCVLLGTLAWGQAAPSAPPPQPMPAHPAPTMPAGGEAQAPAAPPDTSASVPGTAAVLTVTGVCPAMPKAAGAKSAAAAKTAAKTPANDCKTVITKAQFEKLASSLSPNVTPQLRKQLGGLLPRLLAMSEEAKKRGIDKTPEFAERVKFVKMQVLTQELQQQVQKEASKISDDDIKKYYKDHADNFEQYNLDRIFVPRTKQMESEAKADDDKDEKLTDEQKKAKEAADKVKADQAEQEMTKLADSLRTRAAAGEDFLKLQKEAFEAAGMKIESPTVNLPNVRRTGLPPGHVAAFELKAGDVSQVISDTGGHYIYKLNSKTEVPLDQAKNEIQSKLQNDGMRETMEKLNNSFKVDANEAYFGPGGINQPPAPRLPRPRPGMPPAGPSGQPQAPPPAQPPAAQPN